jgi:hypothetical protein
MSDNEQEQTYDNNLEAFQGFFNNQNQIQYEDQEQSQQSFNQSNDQIENEIQENNSLSNYEEYQGEEKSNDIDYEEEMKFNKNKQKNTISNK